MKLEIEITESDIELFKDIVYKNKSVTWEYQLDSGEPIKVEFISEEEKEQRDA